MARSSGWVAESEELDLATGSSWLAMSAKSAFEYLASRSRISVGPAGRLLLEHPFQTEGESVRNGPLTGISGSRTDADPQTRVHQPALMRQVPIGEGK